MNLQTATPVEIDTAIAEIEGRRYDLLAKVAAPLKQLRALQRRISNGDTDTAVRSEHDSLEERVTALKEAAAGIASERTPYDKEYHARGGWTRYFQVQHLHTSTYCSSLRPTTRIGWLPDYSGRAEEEMIDAAGDMVCTKCVPDAPVARKRPTIPELAKEWDKTHGDDNCPGSGTSDWVEGTVRTGYYSGNGGRCSHCNKSVSNTSRHSRTIRKHKP